MNFVYSSYLTNELVWENSHIHAIIVYCETHTTVLWSCQEDLCPDPVNVNCKICNENIKPHWLQSVMLNMSKTDIIFFSLKDNQQFLPMHQVVTTNVC